MKKFLVLIFILCLSSSVFGQQPQPQRRVNYYFYEMDAGPLSLIQITLNAPANVLLLDEGNFQNYRDVKRFDYVGGSYTPSTFYLVPPKQQRWYLVIDQRGGPLTVNPLIRLFSAPTELVQKKP
jgi:hypothetical protein